MAREGNTSTSVENLNYQLDIKDLIPPQIHNIEPHQIRTLFPHPTLIYLKGQNPEVVFVSVLLHGNETTGFECLKRFQEWFENQRFQRSLLVLVGNVFACERGERHLGHQEDFNRIWKGGDSSEHKLAEKVKSELKNYELFSAVDIHNNTGKNPLYACVVDKNKESLYLASLFSRSVVYFENPNTVLIQHTKSSCPSVVLECGQPMNLEGIDKALELVHDLLQIKNLETHVDPFKQIQCYKTVGRVKVKKGATFSFDATKDADIYLPPDIDEHNFVPLAVGDVFGLCPSSKIPIQVLGENNEDLTSHFVDLDNHEIRIKKPVIPSMMTKDEFVIRNDCLGYFMEEEKRPKEPLDL